MIDWQTCLGSADLASQDVTKKKENKFSSFFSKSFVQADCDKYAYDLERAELQHQKAQGGLDKSQEEVARLQVELEKLYDKHDKAQMELRQTHTQLEKYKEETATLEAEVDRFAGRMGKYQASSYLVLDK